MLTRASPRVYDRLYIGGAWVVPSGVDRIEVVNPATEEIITSVPTASRTEVMLATGAAVSGLAEWSRSSMTERAVVLERIADGLESRTHEVASIVSQEVGTPIERSLDWQARQPVTVTRLYAQLARSYSPDQRLQNSLIAHDPVGVVACITPWNFPLHQIMLKVAPALAAGCAVVLKPSGLAPLTAFILAEVIDEAGLPKGAFNLVCGDGVSIGEDLAASPDVDMISLTGSTHAGKRVAAIASNSIKRLVLELGGKSASIILDDADLDRPVSDSVHNCYANAGQTCAAWTRLIAPRPLMPRVEAMAAETAEGYVLGDPLDPRTSMGPIVSQGQLDQVRAYIRKGISEGAKLVTGGPEPPAGIDRGYFVKPTIFSNVSSEMTIAREEIFGPVLAIQPYDTVDEAIAIANATEYGLSGAVWSADSVQALTVARSLQAGQVFVNGAAFNYLAPFGGYKRSGIGREFGEAGMAEYLEVKAIQLPQG